MNFPNDLRVQPQCTNFPIDLRAETVKSRGRSGVPQEVRPVVPGVAGSPRLSLRARCVIRCPVPALPPTHSPEGGCGHEGCPLRDFWATVGTSRTTFGASQQQGVSSRSELRLMSAQRGGIVRQSEKTQKKLFCELRLSGKTLGNGWH